MPIENRFGTCRTCGGPICRYPYPGGKYPDRWAHVNRADWVDSPHDPDPKESTE